MTKPALAAYKTYRDLGDTRTYKKTLELLGKSTKSDSQLSRWSTKYGWPQMLEEHDYQRLRESLGKREVVIEMTRQRVIDWMGEAAGVLHTIMTDNRVVPVLDRHGKVMRAPDGELMVKPMVKPSTKVVCAKSLLGMGGLVEVKRTEHIDRTQESLDQAAQVIDSLGVEELEVVMAMLDQARSGGDDVG